MPLRKEDLKKAKIWTWVDLDFFLFHLATNTDGTQFAPIERKMVWDVESKRIKKLLRGWVHNGEIKPIDPNLDLVRDFEKLEFKRDNIIRCFKEYGIIESIKENGVAIEPKKLKDFEQLMNELPDQDLEPTISKETTQPISPNPDTYPGKMARLKELVFKEGITLLKEGKITTATEFIQHSIIIQLIKNSDLPTKQKPKTDTLKDEWFPEIRKIAGIKGTPGRPKKTQ